MPACHRGAPAALPASCSMPAMPVIEAVGTELPTEREPLGAITVVVPNPKNGGAREALAGAGRRTVQ